MDAGKIKSALPLPDLRAREATPGHAPSSRLDAALAIARIVPGALLDGLRSEAELQRSAGGPEPSPPARAGIVVNLTARALLSQHETPLPGVDSKNPDYAYVKPTPASASPQTRDVRAAAIASEIDLELPQAAALLKSEPAAHTIKAESEPLNTSQLAPDPRVDPYLIANPLAAAVTTAGVAEQRQAISALTQAREMERFAGLMVRGETPARAPDVPLGKLLLVAIALGVLVVLFL